MKKITLMAFSILMAISTFAQDSESKTTAQTAPQRKMLEQGKTWAYVYHHFEDIEDPNPEGPYHIHTMWMSYYTLNGDTVIDGRQYMKMYRFDDHNFNKKYYGAFREDDEGRVYIYDYYGDKKDKKIVDFNMDFDDDQELDIKSPDSIVVEKIKADGQLFRRYRFQYDNHFVPYVAVEGIGFEDKGIAHYLFEPVPDCICDYESLASVKGSGFWFNASAFQAPKEIELTAAEQQLIASNNDFAFNLFRLARGEESSIVSPLSITYALGMMNNGADGLTQQEIVDVLGFGDAGADGINAFCHKMLTEAKTLDNSSYNSAGEDAHAPTTAEIANTIYVNSGLGYELQQDFVEKANTFYNAQPEARDFYDGETWKVINQWASDHTHGMIPKVFSTENDFNSDAVSYLLNAIYFKGAWTNPFDKSNTRDEAFNGGDKVPMMSQKKEFEYTENDLYQAVRLPYGNGAYLMTLFLPREGKTIGDVLAKMDGHNWQFKGEGGCQVDLKMPRFKTETGLKLAPIMSELGMPSAFSAEAEFPYFGNRPVFISDMFQKAVIDLDEEGTTAAAVTVIAAAQSLPREVTFHANRPFFYVISEQSTGVIFFIGQYVGEGTTGSTHLDKRTTATGTPTIYDLQGRRVGSPSGMKKGVYLVGGKKVVVR